MTQEIYFAGEPSEGLGFYAIDERGEPTEYYRTKKACRQAIEDGSDWGLTPQPATQPKRATFTSTKATQRVLLTGLDCLAGQEQLFDTDGTN